MHDHIRCHTSDHCFGPPTHPRAAAENLKDYEQLGNQRNQYTPTNAATELQQALEATVTSAQVRAKYEHALAINKMKDGFTNQINKLTEKDLSKFA